MLFIIIAAVAGAVVFGCAWRDAQSDPSHVCRELAQIATLLGFCAYEGVLFAFLIAHLLGEG